MVGSIVMGVPPKTGWFMREKSLNMDDDWGVPLFMETPKSTIVEDRDIMGYGYVYDMIYYVVVLY